MKKHLHKKRKKLGWDLVLSKFQREIRQEIEDRKQNRIEELQKEVKKLRKETQEWREKWENERQEKGQERNEWKNRFAEEMDQFDVTNFLPHLYYLKGLHLNNIRYRDEFPAAKFLASAKLETFGLDTGDFLTLYPENRISHLKHQIEKHMKIIQPELNLSGVRKYFRNDMDGVIVKFSDNEIVAGIYDDKEKYEAAKWEKSKEMDELIDMASR